jgi:ATP-dependent protease ClpP protease subunit
MATFVALAGKKRLITSNGYWMGHEMSRWAADYYSKEKYRFEYEEKAWLKLRQIYMTQTKLTKKDMYKVDHHELWLDAKQCLEKGIVDEVLGG